MKHLYCSIIMLLLPLFVFSQSAIRIQLINSENDQPIIAQTVILLHTPTGFQKTGVSSAKGTILFANLAPLEGYQVETVESPTYMPEKVTEIHLRSNETKQVDLFLTPRNDIDLSAVTVKAKKGQQINKTNAEISFELPEKELRALPVEGRDITRALYRLPNVSQATGFYPEAPNVSINGANSLFTSYLIDGMDNNERFLGGQKFPIPVGFTKDITVLTNNYSAEYGLSANGIINITTKSGTNDVTGEAFFITRPGAIIDGQTQFPQRDLSGNFVKEGFQRYQTGIGFGGPLVKNKTFYYVNFEHTTDLKQNILRSPDLNVVENVNGRNQFSYLSAKIDHRWGDRWRSSLRANHGIVMIENQGGGLDGGILFPSAGFAQDRISTHISLKNTYSGKRFAVQSNVQYSRFNWDYGEPLQDEAKPQVEVWGPSGQPIAIVGNPDFVFDQTEQTFQWQQKFSWDLNAHLIKFGGGIISSDHNLAGGGSPDGDWIIQLNENQVEQLRQSSKGANLDVSDLPSDASVVQYAVELRPNSFGARQTIYSMYLEDQWQVNDRLRLVLGLRYDYDNLSRGAGSNGDRNNFGPRINANYTLSRRSVIRGGYGLFYDKIVYAIYSDALQQNTTGADYRTQVQELQNRGILPSDASLDQMLFEGNLIGTFTNVNFLNPPPRDELQSQRDMLFSNERRILNPNGYQNPVTHQFSLGYQLQINDNQLFFVDIMHNQSYNLFRLRNLNAAAAYPIDPANVEIRTMAEADASRTMPVFFDESLNQHYVLTEDGNRLYGGARNIMMTETSGKSRYYAASFNFQKQKGNDNWALRVNYTLSQLYNDTEDINFRAMDANRFGQEWGPSINDRTHIFNSIFSYYPVKGLDITIASLLQSGQPINRIPSAQEFGTVDLNGDGLGFGDSYVGNSDRYPGESRNNDRLPWATTFDVGISYQLPFYQSNLELRADIFNLFNAQNLSGYSNNATQSNQIQQGARASGLLVRRNASAPRQFQFTIRYIW